MNVNSSTIIVQVGYCVCTVTQRALTLSGCNDVAVSFFYCFYFLLCHLMVRGLKVPRKQNCNNPNFVNKT